MIHIKIYIYSKKDNEKLRGDMTLAAEHSELHVDEKRFPLDRKSRPHTWHGIYTGKYECECKCILHC